MENNLFYDLDDLQDEYCQLDLMMQGYIKAVKDNTQNDRMADNLQGKSLAVFEQIEKIKNKYCNK